MALTEHTPKPLRAPTARESKAVAYVHEQFSRAERARISTARDWALNKSFIRGYQWVDLNADTADLTRVARKKWEKQATVNLMFSTERVAVAKMSSQEPRPTVTPATNTDEDRDAARGMEGLMSYHWRKQDLDSEWIRFLSDMWSTGGAWWKVSWNPEGGNRINVQPEIVRALGLPVSRKVQHEGILEVTSPNMFNVYVDPGADKDVNARWVIHAHYLHVDEVWERWGVEVTADSPGVRGGTWAIDRASNRYANESDLAVVLEYWERPSAAYPGGRRYVVCNDLALELEEPKADDQDAILALPFVYIPFYPDTECFYGITPVSFSRELQRYINQHVSLMIEQARLNTHGKWLVPSGNKLRITSAPGEQIEFNPTHGPPQWVRGDPVSEGSLRLVEFLRQMKQFVDGIHDSSQGATAGASQSGRATVFQAEEDNSKLGPTLKMLHAGMKRLGRMMLDTWAQNASGELTFRVLGNNVGSQVSSIEAGNIRYEDVEFHIQTNLPDNREARRETIMQLFQVGLVEPDKALSLMEFGDLDELTGSQDRDRQRARNENNSMYAGEFAQPFAHEDHMAHLTVHLSAMKEDRWYSAEPAVQAAFLKHIDETAVLMQGGEAGGVAPPGSSGGGPPPETTPSPPGMRMEDVIPGGQLNEMEMQGISSIQGPQG